MFRQSPNRDPSPQISRTKLPHGMSHLCRKCHLGCPPVRTGAHTEITPQFTSRNETTVLVTLASCWLLTTLTTRYLLSTRYLDIVCVGAPHRTACATICIAPRCAGPGQLHIFPGYALTVG